MTPSRMRLVLLSALGLICIAFLAIGLAADQMLSKQSQRMVDLKLQNHTAEAQLANLASAKRQVEKYTYFNDVAKTVLPSDKNQAQAVLDISQMANESAIAIKSITFPASTLGSASSKKSTTNKDAASASKETVISQAKPVEGIAGLYSLELTITPQTDADTPLAKQVNYGKFLDFLKRIENNRRTAQITSVSVKPADGVTQFSFEITVNIFIKP